jgi:hypothetical protein
MDYSDSTGINWDAVRLAWRARYFRDSQQFHVGYFDTFEQAQVARDRAKSTGQVPADTPDAPAETRQDAPRTRLPVPEGHDRGNGTEAFPFPGPFGQASAEEVAQVKFQKLQAQAHREEITNSVLKGDYVRIDDVMVAIGTRQTELKNRLLGFPSLIAPLVIGRDKDEILKVMTEYLVDLLKDMDKPLDSETILLRNQRLTKYRKTAQPNGQKRSSYEKRQAWRLEAKVNPKTKSDIPQPRSKKSPKIITI